MANYYVDSDSGNDTTGDGSIGNPWRTATEVANNKSFTGDDIIYFKRGTTANYGYWTTYSATQTPTDGHPITLGAYDAGSKPVFTTAGADLIGWTDIGGGIYTYVTGEPAGLLEDGHLLKKVTGTSPGDAQWSYVTDTIYYNPTGSTTPADHTIKPTGYNCISFYQVQANYIIQDLHITGSDAGVWKDATYSGRNISVIRCDFDNLRLGCILMPKAAEVFTSILVEDCTFDYCGYKNLSFELGGTGTGWFDGISCRRNTITHSNTFYNGDGGAGDLDGIGIQNCINSTFENNEISGRCDSAAAINLWTANQDFSGQSNNIIRYNYIHDVLQYGISVAGEATAGQNGNNQIYYNIINNAGLTGIFIDRIQASGYPSKVYNNTIYNTVNGIHIHDTADYYLIKNNCVSTSSTYHMNCESSLTHNTIDKNLYYPDTGTKFFYPSTAYNFADWKTASGQDGNSPTPADPLLVDAGGSLATDYKVQAGSPCINAGDPVGLSTDYGGNPIIDNPDIGAWEQTTYRKVYIGGLYCNITVV